MIAAESVLLIDPEQAAAAYAAEPESSPWDELIGVPGADRWPLLAGSVVVGAVMYGGLLLWLLSIGSAVSGVVHEISATAVVML